MNDAGLRPDGVGIATIGKILPGNARRLGISVGLTQFDPNKTLKRTVADTPCRYSGIFDTGATHSVISERVAKQLELKTTGELAVSTANGSARQRRHIVSVVLADTLLIPALNVTSGPIDEPDFLLGMDIIGMGDLSLTHHFGGLAMHFYVPVYPARAGQPDPPCFAVQLVAACEGDEYAVRRARSKTEYL